MKRQYGSHRRSCARVRNLLLFLRAWGRASGMKSESAQASCVYIVVGSGAGGGTLAARLAEAGRSVVLLEAGGDPREMAGGGPVSPAENRLPEDYDVPVFHPFASENDAMKWDFFVRHYADDERQKLDPNYRAEHDGVLYPRAGTLGGCTAHNAMIMVYPHDADWDHIAGLTGDLSWKAAHMRRYFQRLENCRYRWFYRWLSKIGIDPTRHGWKGWLQTEKMIPRSAFHDRALKKVLFGSVREALRGIGQPVSRLRWFFQGQLDPNDWRLVKQNAV